MPCAFLSACAVTLQLQSALLMGSCTSSYSIAPCLRTHRAACLAHVKTPFQLSLGWVNSSWHSSCPIFWSVIKEAYTHVAWMSGVKTERNSWRLGQTTLCSRWRSSWHGNISRTQRFSREHASSPTCTQPENHWQEPLLPTPSEHLKIHTWK
jgi:hypothetical protein